MPILITSLIPNGSLRYFHIKGGVGIAMSSKSCELSVCIVMAIGQVLEKQPSGSKYIWIVT